MNGTSQMMTLPLASLQKQLSNTTDWRTDPTSGTAAVAPLLHSECSDQSTGLWK